MDNYTRLNCLFAKRVNNLLFNKRFGMKKEFNHETSFFISESLKALKRNLLTNTEKQILFDNLKLISNE